MPEHALPQGAVQRALELQLFGRFTTQETLIAIPQVSAVILLNNPERIGWVMTNTGNVQITLSLAQPVVVAKGIIIPELGDTLSTNYIEDAQFPTHELSAIAAQAGGEVSLIEFIREGV